MVIKVPMLAFVITVYQVSAYPVTLFRGAMLLLHATTGVQCVCPRQVARELREQARIFLVTALELWFFSQPKATFHNDQLQGVSTTLNEAEKS
jgi:hypothetical protein